MWLRGIDIRDTKIVQHINTVKDKRYKILPTNIEKLYDNI
jgi:transcriptional regulator of NAD metabolism